MELHELHEHVKPQPQKEKRPKGMYVLTAWFAFAIISIFISLFDPVMVIGGKVITGAPVIFYNISFILVFLFMIYGLLSKRKWAFYLVIGQEIFSLLFLFVTTALFFINNEESIAVMDQISDGATEMFGPNFYNIAMLVTIFFVTVLSSIIIIYVIKRKNYFTE